MRTLNNILDRLYQSLNIKNDAEFCRKYNIKKNTLSTWKARNKIPYELIEKISDENNLSLDWILRGKGSQNETGEGEMYKTPNNVQNSIIAQGSNHNIVGNIIGSNVDNELKELCEAFQKLSPKKRKYFYHLIMAEVYKEEE